MFNFINRMGCTKAVAGAVGASSKDWTYTISLSINHPAAAANITVVTEGAATYTVTWGDGNVDSGVASGVQAANTYGSPYDGEVLIQSEGKILEISSTAGRWDFNVTALPPTLTDLTISDVNSTIYGLSADLPKTLENLVLSGTGANIQDEFGNGPEPLVTLDLSGTNSTMIAYITNFPANLEYFDVSDTPMVVYGDLNNVPTGLKYFDVSNTSSEITANSQETTMPEGSRLINLSDTSMSSTDVDNVLIALATISSWLTEQTVDLSGNNAVRTSASDAAVALLEAASVTVTVNEATPVVLDIAYIAGDEDAVSANSSLAVPVPAGVSEGDFMVAALYFDGQNGAGDVTPPAGWTEFIAYDSSVGRLRCLFFFYKYASASEPSTYTFTHDGGTTTGDQFSGSMVAFSNVDGTTPFDVTFSAVNHALDDGGEPFTSPDITTVTDKALVVGFQAITHAGCTAAGAPSGFILRENVIGRQDSQHIWVTKEQAVAGTVTPGEYTSTFGDTAGAATSFIFALKPATTAGAPIEEGSQATLQTNQLADTPINLTVVTSDSSNYVVEWGDGTISADVVSGVQTSHIYTSPYDGDVVIYSDGNITDIISTEGGWDFPLTALPSTLEVFKVYGVGVTGAITGTLSQIPAGVTDFQVYNTSAAITGNLGDEPSGMVTMYLSNTDSVIGGVSANMASTFVNLSLRLTESTAAFTLSNLPSSLRLLRLHDSNCTIAASAGTIPASSFEVAELHNLGLTEEVVDDVLATFATTASWSAPSRIDIGGTNADRSTGSNTDVSSLEGNGVTVNANGPVDPGTGEPPPIVRNDVIFTGNFEDGQIYVGGAGDDHWGTEYADNEPYHSRNFQVLSASDPDGITPREGSYCARFYWQKDDPKFGNSKTRTEIKRPGQWIVSDGDEFWMGYSIFIPDEEAMIRNIARPNINNSVTQFHDYNAHGTSQLMTRNNQWEWSFGSYSKQYVGTIVPGKWTDFVIHCKASSSGDGFAKMWIDADSDADTPVYSKTGSNFRSGVNQFAFKAGIYTQDFDNYSPTIAYIKQYHDAYRIAMGSGANFNSVKPGS